ncbi:unnamed protein product [Effrenium voratum]|nr:unnamed protein product [Effrenium voratum]
MMAQKGEQKGQPSLVTAAYGIFIAGGLAVYHFVANGEFSAILTMAQVLPMVAACFLLAALLHADMNSRPLFDTLWMAGLFLSVVSVLPQLWHIHQTGGVISACTGHYIAMLAFSRALSGIFMWHARFDITCAPLVEGVNHAIWAILGAHLLHLCLLGDFGYYYIKAVMQQGLDFKIELPCADMGSAEFARFPVLWAAAQRAARLSTLSHYGGRRRFAFSFAMSKRPVADPEGPVLELLRVLARENTCSFKIGNFTGYYEGRIRGKFQRLDNARQPQPEKAAPPRAFGKAKRKEDWRFNSEDFEPLRLLWQQYIQDLQPEVASLASVDLHGSHVSVISAKSPGLARLAGTVIEETQRTLRIITPDSQVKILPKDSCVFEVEILDRRVRFLGPSRSGGSGSSGSGRSRAWRL